MTQYSERATQIRAYTDHLMQVLSGKIIKKVMLVLVHEG